MSQHPVFILSVLAVLVVGGGAVHGWGGAFLALPSTLLHELCHYLVAYITGSRPAPMNLVPQRTEDSWVLGSVSFHARWFSAAFVALAPLLLLGLAWMLWPGEALTGWFVDAWTGALFGWCLIGAWPSRTDWGIAFRHPAGLMAISALAAWFLHLGQVT